MNNVDYFINRVANLESLQSKIENQASEGTLGNPDLTEEYKKLVEEVIDLRIELSGSAGIWEEILGPMLDWAKGYILAPYIRKHAQTQEREPYLAYLRAVSEVQEHYNYLAP